MGNLNKLQLLILIKVYTAALKHATETLRECADMVGTKPYEDLCSTANDISQELDNLKYQFMYA